MSRPSPWRLLGWVSVCAVLWGSTFPGIKLVYGHWAEQGVVVNFSTRSLFAGVRFVVAGMGLLLLARAPRRELRETPWHLILAMTGAQTVGQYVCFYLGLSLSSGALAALLVSSGSFWWVLLAPPFLGSPALTRRQWFVLLAGGTGVSLAVYSPGVVEGHPQLGGLLILAASFFCAGATGVSTGQAYDGNTGGHGILVVAGGAGPDRAGGGRPSCGETCSGLMAT
ncbi:MAG: DMT family transporter [Candidatus Synoicihabitans palmerolidicus]|nr:DMT family transporter [Candidatus Synoicihabitans palmerolidicus]